jgi:phosphoserine phosphatase RsbU/P
MAMTQRTLYKTIEKIGLQTFPGEEAMLAGVLGEFIRNDHINIIGGRIWKLIPDDRQYELIHEQGNIESVSNGFRISIKDYVVFDRVAHSRTVLSDETNRTLRRKGIVKYSATGIGRRVKIGRIAYYEYIMAFNTVETEHDMVHTLNIAGQALTQLLEKRRSDAEKRSLESEMEHAATLQRQILPAHEFQFGRYEFYGISLPERIVGGDFFNYYQIPTDQERVAVAIGDAASKGFPAAVQALFVSGALMMSVEIESRISSTLRRINTINRKIFPDDKLLSLFYGELFDGKEGLMLFANAGHPHPVHYHAETRTCSLLPVTGPIIGLIPDAKFNVGSCNLKKNDIVALYTDGIIEASMENEEFGEQRLIELIQAHANLPPKTIAQRLIEAVQIFGAHGVYSDDKTVVIIKRTR